MRLVNSLYAREVGSFNHDAGQRLGAGEAHQHAPVGTEGALAIRDLARHCG